MSPRYRRLLWRCSRPFLLLLLLLLLPVWPCPYMYPHSSRIRTIRSCSCSSSGRSGFGSRVGSRSRWPCPGRSGPGSRILPSITERRIQIGSGSSGRPRPGPWPSVYQLSQLVPRRPVPRPRPGPASRQVVGKRTRMITINLPQKAICGHS